VSVNTPVAAGRIVSWFPLAMENAALESEQ
jgi:hypothetical protein